MNDTMNEIERYQRWVDAVNVVWKRGWRCYSGWIFISPSGTKHDLSSVDLSKLSRIEREGLFLYAPNEGEGLFPYMPDSIES